MHLFFILIVLHASLLELNRGIKPIKKGANERAKMAKTQTNTQIHPRSNSARVFEKGKKKKKQLHLSLYLTF